jgi:hypothetical protein
MVTLVLHNQLYAIGGLTTAEIIVRYQVMEQLRLQGQQVGLLLLEVIQEGALKFGELKW